MSTQRLGDEGALLAGLTVAQASYDAGGDLASVSYPGGLANGGNGSALAVARDGAGRTARLTWTGAGGAVLAESEVTRSQSGKVVDERIDGTDADAAGPNYTYDAAGRLRSARVPGHALSYAYDPSGGCGPLASAGNNTNRTSVTDNGATTTYCYDNADRLTSTLPALSPISYDAHGNTTALRSEPLTYHGAGRHVAPSQR